MVAPDRRRIHPAPGGIDTCVGTGDYRRVTEVGTSEGRAPARGHRWGARVWRVLRHEWTLASLVGLALAVLMTWPTLRDPAHTIPGDTGDPTLQAWQLAWAGHAMRTNPMRLWDTNGFYPESWTFAYSDTLLGYLPFGLVGEGPVAAVIRYNILFALAHALAFVGAYALLRQLGANWAGGAVAGVSFAFAPWRLAHAGHLNVLSTGGIALALAMLARGHGWSLRYGYRPDRRRPGWALAGWLVAAWQITLGFGLGVPFGYVLGLVGLLSVLGYGWRWWRRRARPPFGGRLLAADVIGAAIFAAVVGLMALPYLKVVELHPYGRRSLAEVGLYSPPLRAFVTAPETSWLWGERHAGARQGLFWPPEMTLLPGFVLIGLAAAGLIFSVWRLRQRLLLAVGVLATVALAMGTALPGGGDPGYATLYRLLPGWDALRTSGRLVLWTTLLLAVLAAGAVSAFAEQATSPSAEDDGRTAEPARDPTAEPTDRVARRPRWWAAPAMLIVVALVLAEGLNTTGHPGVWLGPTAMRGLSGPLLVLPSAGVLEDNVLLWSTDGFPKVVNGLSGMTPASQDETRARTASFPDQASVAYLREIGVRTVLFLPGLASGTPWQDVGTRPVAGLGITKEDRSGDVVFHLD